MSAPETSLLTRGRQSVRLMRRDRPDGRVELVIGGPDGEGRAQLFDTLQDCLKHQSAIERQLIADGFTRQETADRRRGPDRRRRTRSDRRRPPD